MNRAQLEHAIRAACRVAEDDELFVFGSQAVLGEHPDVPETLRASIELDVQPKNRPEAVDAIDGALGEMSLFHRTHGFYVHGVSIDSADLPTGWEERTVTVSDPHTTRGCSGLCLESHDLAASKLAAYRDKDLEFVTTLLSERLISASVLLERVAALSIHAGSRERLARWVEGTAAKLGLEG